MSSDQSSGLIATKVHGRFPVSIGTSLAIETLFGLNENIVPTDPLPYTKYKYLIVNTDTLLRNVMGAVDKELKTTWTQEQYVKELIEEMLLLPNIISDQSHGKIEVVYYNLAYDTLDREFPNAYLKKPKSQTSFKNEVIENYARTALQQAVKNKEMVVTFDHLKPPRPIFGNIALLTHMPVDLLTYIDTDRCDLLESHTGVIKGRYQWYTKLAKGGIEGIERIPFTKKTLQLFGDNKLFSGCPSKQKKLIVQFAIDNRWNQLTTDRVITKQLARFPDHDLRVYMTTL